MGSFCSKAKSKNDNNLIAIKEQEQTFIKYKHSQEEILKSKEVFKSQYRKVLEQRYYALNPNEGLNFEQLQLLFPKIAPSKDSTIQRTSKKTICIDFTGICLMISKFLNSGKGGQVEIIFQLYDLDKDQSLNSTEFQLLVEENQNLLIEKIKSYQKFSKAKFINWADGNLKFDDTFKFNLFVRPDQEKKIIEEKKYQIENDNMYIISPKWWDKWNQYVNTPNKNPKQQQNNNEDQESLQQFLEIDISQWQARPGPIDNKDIAGENEGELKVQGRNYGAVGKEAWENLLRWYGITDKKLEFKRKCHFEDDQPQKKLQSTIIQGSEKNNDPPKILQPTIIQGFETNNKGNVLYKKCFKLKVYENSTMHDIRRKLFQKYQINTKNCSEYLLYMMKINEDWKLILDLDSNIMSLNITSGTFFTMTKLQIKPKSQVNNWKLGQKSLIKDPTNDNEQMCIVQNFSEDLTEVFLHIEGQSFLNDFKLKIKENIQSFSSQIGGVSRKTQYTGLQNLGNTCYMNAALQSLISSNYFNLFLINEKYKRFITADNSLTKELSLLAKELNNTKEPSISPQSFQDAFIKIFPKFRQYEAQDADEFIADLLSHISKELNENENKQTSVTDNLFQGEYLTQRKCKNNKCKNLKEEKDLKRIFHLNIQKEKDIFRLRLLIFMNLEFIYDSQEKLNNLKKKDLLKKTFIFKSKTPKMGDLSQKIQSFMGLSQQEYELANIYEKEIQKTFIINNNEDQKLKKLGIHRNKTLYLYQLGSEDEAKNQFLKISKMFNYPSQNFKQQDLVDFCFSMNGKQNWKQGKIEQVYNPSSSFEYQILYRSQQQSDNKLEYIRIKEKQQIVKFREKTYDFKLENLQKVPVVNYVFHSQRKQYILTLKPIILFLPLQYLSLQELKVYIYKQIQRFISVDHFKVSSPFQSSNVSQQDIINFFGNQSFPYKIRVLDQDRKCLYCEKIRLLKNNTNWNCPGCEVDPILLNFQQSTKPQIILEWNDVSLTKKLEKRKNEDEEKELTPLNLKDCLKKYSDESKLKLICENCSEEDFIQNSYLIKPPINLIINFQKYKRNGEFIERYIDFQDNDLNISDCLKKEENTKEENTKEENTNYNYNLYAVINAVRKKKYTHYTAYIKKQGRWYEFNDSQVTLVDKVQSNDSYMLFYTIKDIPTDYDLRNSDFT